MKLSWKQMVISFAAALLIFSLVMIPICVGIFNSRVKERTGAHSGIADGELSGRNTVYEFSDAVIYYADDGNAVMVCVSDVEKILLLMPISADLPIRYEDKIYFVSSLCEQKGTGELFNIGNALTGIMPDHLFSVDVKHGDLVKDVLDILKDEYGAYTTETVLVQTDGDGIADCVKTLEQFFIAE